MSTTESISEKPVIGRAIWIKWKMRSGAEQWFEASVLRLLRGRYEIQYVDDGVLAWTTWPSPSASLAKPAKATERAEAKGASVGREKGKGKGKREKGSKAISTRTRL